MEIPYYLLQLPLCRFYLRGKCGMKDCPYLHVFVGSDAPICRTFATTGFCSKADKVLMFVCTYIDYHISSWVSLITAVKVFHLTGFNSAITELMILLAKRLMIEFNA